MKKGYFLLFSAYFLLLTVFLWGCGSGPGSPGSQDTEDTGVKVDTSISFSGNASDDIKSPNVDAFQEICPDGKAEPFRDHPAQITFDARLLNPNTTFQPGTLYIEKYTVEFRRKSDSIGAPPIESFTGNERVTIVPPTGSGVSSVTTTLMLVDLKRKFKYANDMFYVTPGAYTSTYSFINNYTATYTFEGQNEFGKSFSLTAQTDFSIGDFANCP